MDWTVNKNITVDFSFTEEERESMKKTADILYHIAVLLDDYDTIKIKSKFNSTVHNTLDIASLEDLCGFIRTIVDIPTCEVS